MIIQRPYKKEIKVTARRELDYTINEKTQCFEITSHVPKPNGYIRVSRNGVPIYAHRLAYIEANGGAPIPKGRCVMHSCDNRRCVNPAHLSLGTSKDNSQDMVKKKRSCFGEKNPMAKITLEEAKQIKLEDSITTAAIAKKFNISITEVRGIKSGMVWKELTQVKHNVALKKGARIDARQAAEIRNLRATHTYKQIMQEYDIKKSMVFNIWSNKSWKT